MDLFTGDVRLRVSDRGFSQTKKTCVMRSGVKALISVSFSFLLFFLSVSVSRVTGGAGRIFVPHTLRKQVKGNTASE